MDNQDGITKILDIPTTLLETVARNLSRVGIELPLLASQLSILILLLLVLYPVARRFWKTRRKTGPWGYGVGGAAVLMAIGTVIGIIDQMQLPDTVLGTMQVADRSRVKVELLDFRDDVVSVGSGVVDSETGVFALTYSPVKYGQARKLRVSAHGCAAREFPISAVQVRSGRLSDLTFICEKR